jgi:hypothetical protein
VVAKPHLSTSCHMIQSWAGSVADAALRVSVGISVFSLSSFILLSLL